MKIIHVLNFFPPEQIAGTEIYTLILAKEQLKMGHDVSVLIPNFDTNINFTYQHEGIKVYKYAEPTKADRLVLLGKKKTAGLANFHQYLEAELPDVVHFQEVGASNGININHIHIAKEVNAKLIITFHVANYTCKTGTLFYKNTTPCNGVFNIQKCTSCYIASKEMWLQASVLTILTNTLYSLNINTATWQNKIGTALASNFIVEKNYSLTQEIIDLANHVVVISQWYKEVLLANSFDANKITLIKQQFELDAQINKPDIAEANNEKLALVFLGRLSPIKGIQHLIDVIIQLPKDKVTLDIYGQTTDFQFEQVLKNKTKDFPNVHWAGRLPQEEVIPTLQKYDALCLCSTVCEMSPLVIDDAFNAGIPVIASNVLGNAEKIIHNVNGFLFNFNDSIDLLSNINKCLIDSNIIKRLKQNIYKLDGFKAIAKAYDNIYSKQ